MGAERREFPRVREPFRVEYRCLTDLGVTRRPVTTVNLSAGGLRLRSSDALEVDTLLEIAIKLPGAREPILLRGRVVWCELAASGVSELGVEFYDVTMEQRIQLDTLVHFMRRRV
jgi:c-di-GMP-binding flagellar brake protein YcgR